jgi:hypothetical protein
LTSFWKKSAAVALQVRSFGPPMSARPTAHMISQRDARSCNRYANSASHFNRIECHFQLLREFVLNASEPAMQKWPSLSVAISSGKMPTIRTSRIRLLESRSKIA